MNDTAGSAVMEDRGEVAVMLDGVERPARPSYEAQVAIERSLGISIEELFIKVRRTASAILDPSMPATSAGLTLMQMAAVIAECVNAAGKARNDPMLKGWKIELVAELVSRDRYALNQPVAMLITNMLFGGADPKKAPPETPTG